MFTAKDNSETHSNYNLNRKNIKKNYSLYFIRDRIERANKNVFKDVFPCFVIS